MIIELQKILTPDECDELIAFFENNPQVLRTGDAQPMFDGRTIEGSLVSGKARQIMEGLKARVLIAAAKYYHLEELYLDFWSLTKWTDGQDMEWHADNVTDKREPHYYCHWRDYSAIVYLNHDFEGGTTLFRHQREEFIPTKGHACLFPATYNYTHSVKQLKGGPRYTVSIWMTRDREQAV